jgi:hypothetical protein
MATSDNRLSRLSRLDDQFNVDLDAAPEGVQAWEMVDGGRYMPRRVRGSFPGRALG